MKKLLSFFAVLFAVLILSSNSFAQQWTSEQKEVWQTEIKCWDALQSGNVDFKIQPLKTRQTSPKDSVISFKIIPLLTILLLR